MTLSLMAALVLALAIPSTTAQAAGDDGAGVVANPHVTGVDVYGSYTTPGDDMPGLDGVPLTAVAADPTEYQWLLACSQNYPSTPMTDCGSAHTCPKATAALWILWSRPAGSPDTSWNVLRSECYDERPALPIEPDLPTVTPAMVEEAVRRMGLPALPVQVQPANATLVNFDTIFFARPEPFDESVTLVGFDVRVLAEPVAYGWSFGDGAAVTTSVPGGPYPAKDVVHRYTDAHVTVQPSVDVTYEVRYSVNGGQMQELGTTLTAEGPPTGLRIREATPLLVGAG